MPLRPSPLRTDGSNEFASFSMRVRVPKILEDTLRENPDYPPSIVGAVVELAARIRDNGHLPLLEGPCSDDAEWGSDLQARSWLATEWFFAECYVYRSLMSSVRYWESGRDPFAPAKSAELASEALWQRLAAALEGSTEAPRERVHALLGFALWGNRVDFSYAVGAAFGHEGAADDLLVDDRAWAAETLVAPGGDVHIVADNTGTELAIDLALADALIGTGARVTLHVKVHPTFVSDAMVGDVWQLVAAMRARGGSAGELASRLGRAFDDERLRVLPDFYWNGPRFLWDRPPSIARRLDGATMVVLKGDANYRRAVGDAMWPAGSTFAKATSYFPASLLSVRTLKSDALVGLSAERMTALDAADPKWRINGRRGLLQGNLFRRGGPA